MKRQMTPVKLPDARTGVVAIKMLGYWLGENGGGLRHEDVLAGALGHDGWQSLVDSATTWRHGLAPMSSHTHSLAAARLAELTGRPSADCWDFIAMAGLDGSAWTPEQVMEEVEARYAGKKAAAKVIGAFRTYPFLLDDADAALRLRAVGKGEPGFKAAMDDGTLDVFDALDASGGRIPAAFALALYYSASHSRVATCAEPWRLRDSADDLSSAAFPAFSGFLKAAEGFPPGGGLDHLAVSLMFFEPPFPLPASHADIRAAIRFYRAVEPSGELHFGMPAPNCNFDPDDWQGSWEATADHFTSPGFDIELLAEGSERIADFVHSYVPGADPTWESVQFGHYQGSHGFTGYRAAGEKVKGMDDETLARFALSKEGHAAYTCPPYRDMMDGCDLQRAALACLSGAVPQPPRKPQAEDNDDSWMDHPELKKLAGQFSDMVWKR